MRYIVLIILFIAIPCFGEELPNFCNLSPNDPVVLEAKAQHKDFNSPLGTHYWSEGGYYRICGPYADYWTARWCVEVKGWEKGFFQVCHPEYFKAVEYPQITDEWKE